MLMEGKAGLVTAAGSGIGRQSAMTLATNGAKVMVSDINEESAKETVRLIQEAGGTADYFICNVASEEQVQALVAKTVEVFGKLDFAHNNAGIGAEQGPILKTSSEGFDRVMKVNVYGLYYSLKAQIEVMMKQGTGGAIVNTASGAGLEGVMNMVAYSSSKWAVNGMTKSVALEYARHGIRINSICPGMTLTPAVEHFFNAAADQAEVVRQSIPSGVVPTAEDQANAVLFLCSDLSKQITGQNLPVDGGYTAGKLG